MTLALYATPLDEGEHSLLQERRKGASSSSHGKRPTPSRRQQQAFQSSRTQSLFDKLHSHAGDSDDDGGDFVRREGMTSRMSASSVPAPAPAPAHAYAPPWQQDLLSSNALQQYHEDTPAHQYVRKGGPVAPVVSHQNDDAKLNYVIQLLEKQQDEATQRVTEEVVLYSFLGIFMIFMADSLVRIGRRLR